MAKANLGCGTDIRQGYVNVDSRRAPGVDEVVDFDHFPWSLKSAAFDEVLASHILEHVDDPLAFLRECARILRPGGQLVVYIPYWKNAKATWGNFDHKRAIHPHAFEAVGPRAAASSDLVQQTGANLFETIDWSLGNRPHRWGQSMLLPGFLRMGKSRLGIITHLWYRLRLRRFLRVEEIMVVLRRARS